MCLDSFCYVCLYHDLLIAGPTFSDNGKPLNFTQFLKFVENLRAGLSNRKLVSESFVVGTPTDPKGKSGAIAHISHITGIQEGKKVKTAVVGVLNVHWVEDPKEEAGGHRVIVSESFVVATQPLA